MNMHFLPISIRITDRRVLIVGGGRVAWQKLQTLLQYTRNIVVRAPEVAAAIEQSGIRVDSRPYGPDCLEGSGLVFACTDSRDINRLVVADARARGIPACCADDPEFSDFISPAVAKEGRMSVAVSSDATDVKRAIAWRNAIRRLIGNGELT